MAWGGGLESVDGCCAVAMVEDVRDSFMVGDSKFIASEGVFEVADVNGTTVFDIF